MSNNNSSIYRKALGEEFYSVQYPKRGTTKRWGPTKKVIRHLDALKKNLVALIDEIDKAKPDERQVNDKFDILCPLCHSADITAEHEEGKLVCHQCGSWNWIENAEHV